MIEKTIFIILFGCLCHLLLLALRTSKKEEYTPVLLPALLFPSLLTMFSVIRYGVYNIYTLASIFISGFILLTTTFLAKKILPPLHELQVVIWVIFFWYIRIVAGPDLFTQNNLPIFLSDLVYLTFSITTVAISVFHIRVQKTISLMLYVWFLYMIAFTSIMILPELIHSVDSYTVFSVTDTLLLFLYGFQIFHVICSVLYLFDLIPIPGRNQSMESKKLQLKLFLETLYEKYDMHRFKGKTILVAMLSMMVIITLGTQYQIYSPVHVLILTLSVGSILRHVFEK